MAEQLLDDALRVGNTEADDGLEHKEVAGAIIGSSLSHIRVYHRGPEDKGRLKKSVSEKRTKVATTRHHLRSSCMVATPLGTYTKKDGTKGFCGTKALKKTQSAAQHGASG